MLDWLLQFDSDVLVYLNSLGSESWDGLWLFLTKQFNWIPLFLVIFYLVFKNLGWRHAILAIVMIALLITITDQTTNLAKNYFQRFRPCNAPDIKDIIRIVKHRSSFSFFSGHASNSMASAFFLYKVLKPYFKSKWLYIIFLWPLVFAYSRIYLGLHYPLDILSGFAWGIFTASLVLVLYRYLRGKFFTQAKQG
ncbi:phosphatase PAP2 family protein [Flavobacterium arcticum]|uniref:Phosphatase PAP2 family protein n=1 Tax=Flavobacterium arcticum TaxID=1784713 RepID=A0A345HCB9_9FLAO|nr:phosphatase PAP2 family protein [Flavobacterium arcticum]AXG74229.1 phosphatase PAP2 family protein [Flavobacterium arcticum]KAF2508184.1 phosphatase PAP2 family protein [Flavobacterium arcticum]